VWVCRQDWHMCLANSVAMELANITQDTPEPQGGTIQKDIHGVPTGVFVDTAMSLVTRFVPKPSLEERRAALIAAGKLALARGVTSVVDFGRFSPGETAQQAWDDFDGIKCPTLFVML
jgi:predicted amidohydrolase YtcJ